MKVLLTGGGGFLGGRIAAMLVEAGHEVRSFSRGQYPALDALGVEHRQGDLASKEDVADAALGCDAIIHTAAKAGVWGDPEDYHRANVLGTDNILAACEQHTIETLVYTSTPSVVHQGGDIENGDRSLPYAAHASTAYQATKTLAEKNVFAAGERDGFNVVALRPHLIWGPNDPHLVKRIVARTRRGRLALPGGGRKLVDAVYVDNAAAAHLAALEALSKDGSKAACAGNAYFVTNGEPMPISEIALGILDAAGIDAKVVDIPVGFANFAGGLLESSFRAFGAQSEPPLTRFVVEQLSTAHYFDHSETERDLGWKPEISMGEGFALLKEAFERA